MNGQLAALREGDRYPDIRTMPEPQRAALVDGVKALGQAMDQLNAAVGFGQGHAAMRELFKTLDPTAVHVAMVKTLKRSRDLAPLSRLVDQLPRSLHAAALSIQVRRTDHERIVEAVSTPLGAAMAWA